MGQDETRSTEARRQGLRVSVGVVASAALHAVLLLMPTPEGCGGELAVDRAALLIEVLTTEPPPRPRLEPARAPAPDRARDGPVSPRRSRPARRAAAVAVDGPTAPRNEPVRPVLEPSPVAPEPPRPLPQVPTPAEAAAQIALASGEDERLEARIDDVLGGILEEGGGDSCVEVDGGRLWCPPGGGGGGGRTAALRTGIDLYCF